MSNTSNLNKLPYAHWLEESLQQIVDMPVESMCIMTKFADTGAVHTAYFNCSPMDKLMFAGLINQDAMIDTLKINRMVPGDDEEEVESDE